MTMAGPPMYILVIPAKAGLPPGLATARPRREVPACAGTTNDGRPRHAG